MTDDIFALTERYRQTDSRRHSTESKVQFSISLDEDLKKKLRMRSAVTGETQNAIIQRALENLFDKEGEVQ